MDGDDSAFQVRVRVRVRVRVTDDDQVSDPNPSPNPNQLTAEELAGVAGGDEFEANSFEAVHG